MRPPVSVLLPVHDAAPYLPAALDSILSQTFEDFELVACDDASTDGSFEICRERAASDSRLRLYRNPRNLGMTRNWNVALRHSSGRLILKMDADDVMRPRLLQTLFQELDAAPDLEAAACRALDCDAELEPLGAHLGEQGFHRSGLDPGARLVQRGRDWYRLCFHGYQLWASNAQMWRREVLESLGGWDERFGCAPDTDLILRLLERDGRVVHHPYAGVWYRRRPGSVSAVYRDAGWRSVEGTVIHLESLRRHLARGGRFGAALWKAWYRHWADWRRTREALGRNPEGLPPALRGEPLEEISRRVEPPPAVELAFRFRRILGRLARPLRRAAMRPEWSGSAERLTPEARK